jgi:hypothetical protein
LGAAAMSGRFSQLAAHLCLLGAVIVGVLGIFRSSSAQPRLAWGGALMLLGFCLVISHWVRPPHKIGEKPQHPPFCFGVFKRESIRKEARLQLVMQADPQAIEAVSVILWPLPPQVNPETGEVLNEQKEFLSIVYSENAVSPTNIYVKAVNAEYQLNILTKAGTFVEHMTVTIDPWTLTIDLDRSEPQEGSAGEKLVPILSNFKAWKE